MAKLQIGQRVQFRYRHFNEEGSFSHFTYHEGTIIRLVTLQGGLGVLLESTQPDCDQYLWTPTVAQDDVVPA